MKIKNILYILCFAFVLIPLIGCDGDDETMVTFDKNVLVDTEYIELNPNESSTATITDGNGQYKVKSTDEEIVTATINNETVNIQSHKPGKASIIITDTKNVSSIVNILVYTDVTLEVKEKEMKTNSSEMFKITSGNGGYRVESSDTNLETLLEENEDGTFVVLKSTENELSDAVVTVFDRTGRSATMKVSVVDPYTIIKNDATERVQFKGYTKTVGTNNIVFYNSTTTYTGYHVFGWNEDYDYEKKFEVRIPTTNDLTTIGVKTGATLKFDFYGYGDYSYISGWRAVDAEPNLEVIKYDSATNLVWIVFYYTYRNVKEQGIVCMKI